MGVFEKIKNALFEVEYVEEEVPTKKEKKIKPKETERESVEDKPIAKKIVLPGKKEEKVEEIKEEELRDENFEIRPKNEYMKPSRDTFKFMDDDDFKVEEEPVVVGTISQSVQTPVGAPIVQNNVIEQPQIVSQVQSSPLVTEQAKTQFNNNYVQEYDSYKERTSSDDYLTKPKESKPYGMDPSYQVSIKQYGSYDNRDEKTYFKPSPIISPIYGVLDKNYKKEDVVPKKSVRLSNYSRGSVSVDAVRNKAFAEKLDDHIEVSQEPVIESSFEVEEDDDDNLLVDLNNDREKPEVKEITVGDADEYFNDLGLEYNVDYVDVSNKKRRSADLADDIKMNMDSTPVAEELTPKMIEEDKEKKVSKTPTVEVVNESGASIEEDDDNLFDLIDSMYKEDK